MTKVVVGMSVSLDGIAGPESADADGMAIFAAVLGWQFPLRSWREQQGQEGGEDTVDSRVWADNFARFGPQVIGRRMFDYGYPNWGENPPFHAPVFVLTHRGQERIDKSGGTSYTFVTGAIEAAAGRPARWQAARTCCWPAGSASLSRRWPPGSSTRSYCMSPQCWSAGVCGCSAPHRQSCAASRPSTARAQSTCAMRSGDRRPCPLSHSATGLPTAREATPGGAGMTLLTSEYAQGWSDFERVSPCTQSFVWDCS